MVTGKKHKTQAIADVDYWLAEWLKSDHRESPRTHTAYRSSVQAFLLACAKPFDQVTALDIQDYYSTLKDSYAAASAAQKLASLRSFYRFLNAREVTSVNIDRIEGAKIIRAVDRDKLLTEKEVQALIHAAAADLASHVFVRFLYLTAARLNEALGLRWRDLTPLKKGSGQAHIVGKGKKHRDVFIPRELWQDLKRLRGGAMDDGHLFPALTPYKAWEMVKQLGRAAQITKRVSPHSLRHAHLSHALQNGATLVELRDQAGHANISTTSLYLHANSEKATATRLKVR